MSIFTLRDEASGPAGPLTRRSFALAAALFGTSAAAAAVTPHRHERTLGKERLEDVMPARVGPWSAAPGGAVVLPEANQPVSVYDQVLTRTFVAPDLPPVMLLIAYGGAQSGLMKVHRPEICYASSGFKIINPATAPLPLAPGKVVPSRAFLAERQDRSEDVLYWTRVSDAFPDSLDAQRWIMTKEGARGIIPDGVLVRLSTFARFGDAGPKALRLFAQTIVSASNPLARSVLIGRATPSANSRTGAA